MTTLIVTRPVGQAENLVSLLAARGIDAVHVPTVEIVPASPGSPLDQTLQSLAGADWLVITSANGATAIGDRLSALGVAIPASTRVAAVGPATAGALRRLGITVHHVPTEFRTVEIANGLGDVTGRRVVLARADAATPHLRQALAARGAVVEEVVAYLTLEGPTASRDQMATALSRGIDGIAFTSGSTVRGLRALVRPADAWRVTSLPAYCIGPVTAKAAREAGFSVPVVAQEHTAAGLAAAIHQHLHGSTP